MHWADVVADKLLEQKEEHVISSGITPSGPIHLGSMREILTADAIVRAVNDKGGKAELIYVADNADPLRKVYPFLDKGQYEKYVGKPLAEIPGPDGECSYDEYFLEPFFEALKQVGVYPKVVNNYNQYKKGKYNECIKILLDNKDKVRNILETISGRQLPKNWFPWTFKDSDGTLCEGKLVDYNWPYVTFENKKDEVVKNNLEIGEGKLPWRLDWPTKWKTLGVTFEAFGKDHATKGGSFDTGRKIVSDILGSRIPHHIVYEWINLKGKGAMHSSTGLAISANEMLTMAPPEVIRWLIMQPQPNRHIDFDPGLGLLNSVDKYDKLEEEYKANSLEDNSSRAFELSQIGDYSARSKSVSYRHLVTLTQSKSSIEEVIDAFLKIGEIQEFSSKDKATLKTRMACIKGWLENYAPESVKFEIQEEAPEIKFSHHELGLIGHLKATLVEIEWKSQNLHDSFYSLQDKHNIPAKEYFKVMYNILLDKDRGPRLGFFLASMEREFVLNRLKHYLR